MFNALRQLGGAVGVALFTTVIVAIGAVTRLALARPVVPHLTAYRAGFLVAAAIGLLAVIPALGISDRQALATIPSGPRRRALEAATPAVAAPTGAIERRAEPEPAILGAEA